MGLVLVLIMSLAAAAGSTPELLKQAREEAAAGRRRESAVLLYKVLEADPGQKTAWARLAVLYEKEGQFPQAQWLWGRLAMDEQWGGEALYSMAALSEEMGRPAEAIRFYLAVPQYHPRDDRWVAPSVVRAADLWAASGDRARARSLIEGLLKSGQASLGREPLERRLKEWK